MSITNLKQGYLADQKVLDECFNQHEEVRDSWKRLITNIENLGINELRNRSEEHTSELQSP